MAALHKKQAEVAAVRVEIAARQRETEACDGPRGRAASGSRPSQAGCAEAETIAAVGAGRGVAASD